MFETSPQPDFWPTSESYPASSSARPPVRMPALPTREARASTASVPASSSRPSELSASANLFGHALRTSLACELEALSGSSSAWKKQATPFGRWWWVLSTPAPRTGATGFGSLLPTPLAVDAGEPRALRLKTGEADRDSRDPTKAGNWRGDLKDFAAAGLLPTPRASDWKSSAWTPETMAKNSRPLNETARASGIAGTAASLVVLVEWMMGYPAGWLARALPPSAMPSSHKSPKRSPEPCGD